MPIPNELWNIGQLTIKELRWGVQNEYRIRIVTYGIEIYKNEVQILNISYKSFIDYHFSERGLIIEYDDYGPKQLRIPTRHFSDNDKQDLSTLLHKVDGWKKDRYSFVYNWPKDKCSKAGNEGMVAIGQSYLKFGNVDKAVECAKQANEISPTLDSYLLLLDVYHEQQDETAFIETYKKATEQNDDAIWRAILDEKVENA